MAVATTTRVRSEGVLRKIRDSRFIGLLGPEHEPHAADRVQQPGRTAGLQLAA
jgi:hypothetical protein